MKIQNSLVVSILSKAKKAKISQAQYQYYNKTKWVYKTNFFILWNITILKIKEEDAST